ncbi:hypothetical protein [Methylobacterium sp. P5_C11]
MPRPFEPYADALRTAREIVREQAGAIVEAAVRAESQAYDEACNVLVVRIAQALVDAREAGPGGGLDRGYEAA